MRLTQCFPPTLETIVFFDLFERPVHQDELRGTLSHPAVTYRAPFYFLNGREKIVLLHEKKRLFQNQLWRKVDRFRWLFRMVPFIRMVGVCNSVALGTSTKQSDIDLFIIIDRSHFFTGRLLLTLACHLLGVRRHGEKIAGRFCLSFFVRDDALLLDHLRLQPSDPYFDYWLYSLFPLMGSEIYKKFWHQNLPGVSLPVLHSFSHSRFFSFLQWVFELPFRTFLGVFVEKKLLHWQLSRATNKKTGNGNSAVLISPKILKFHENDRRLDIQKKFLKKLTKI